MLCSIADVYDAMRSQRAYQQAFPTDRILAVLQRNDGTQFDQNLVRRFVQLLGIYPPGNLVRLSTGEIAVVARCTRPTRIVRASACCSTSPVRAQMFPTNAICSKAWRTAFRRPPSSRLSTPPRTAWIR